MKNWLIFFVFMFYMCASAHVYSKDMRMMIIEAQKKKEFVGKAKAEEENALKEAKKVQDMILKNRSALLQAIQALKKRNKDLILKRKKLRKELEGLKTEEEKLLEKRDKEQLEMQELISVIRADAKDLKGLLDRSIQSAFFKGRTKKLEPIIKKLSFPAMSDIKNMVSLLFQEICLSGQVRLTNGMFVDRSGRDTKGKILVVGNFEAVYKKGHETGFLIYSEISHRLFALSKLPPHNMIKKLNKYIDGKSDSIPIDISKGAALRQLVHRLSLMEEIPKGGPIIYPIILIGIIAFFLILERAIYLYINGHNIEALVSEFMFYLSNKDWTRCIEICKKQAKKPIFKVFMAGLEEKNIHREELENVLQEAILGEIPRLERFLSTISMLAEISPLLGLLGTVTGIINTFHVITFYGTGDPRMMSSGISEALVTTMLGLMVAIPVMFCHTLLSRKVENMITNMEKNAVSFINILFTERNKNVSG